MSRRLSKTLKPHENGPEALVTQIREPHFPEGTRLSSSGLHLNRVVKRTKEVAEPDRAPTPESREARTVPETRMLGKSQGSKLQNFNNL